MLLPRIIHRIWIGSVLSQKQIIDLLDARQHIKGHVELWLWTSHPIQLNFPGNIFNNIVIKDINSLFLGGLPSGVKYAYVHAAFERERHGTYHNYAAASDIARLLILYRYGGVYFDMDVTFKDSVFDFFSDLVNIGQRLGVLTNSAGLGIGNGVLASMPQTTAMKRCIYKVADLYHEGPAAGLSWSRKRDFSRLRFSLTMSMSGPDLIIDELYDRKLLVPIYETRYFRRIDSSGNSFMKAPTLMRRSSQS